MQDYAIICRSPRGERGLKFRSDFVCVYYVVSLPSRGAWIEIIIHYGHIRTLLASLPSRGAWIEIRTWLFSKFWAKVAPLAGSVD